MRVGIRHLKSHLSHILAQAQRGERIEVTSHRRPVAHIIGVPQGGPEPLQQLIRTGAVVWNGCKPAFSEPVVLTSGARPVSQLVVEDRR